ncbi:MAG: hypothetical protein LBP93_01385 [Treponema sp.]|jgi:hypothetical protein|nr:hypothetical protein [Treponema sp.]
MFKLRSGGLLLAILLLFSGAGKLWGELFYEDSPEVSLLRRLYRRAGKVLPLSAYPVHGSDLAELGEKLSTLKSGEDQLLLEELLDRLKPKEEEALFLHGSLAAAYEHRFRTGSTLVDDGAVKNGEDVRRAYLGFSPLLSLEGGVEKFTGPYTELQAELRPPWKEDFSPYNNFVPLPEVDISFDLLSKGIFSWNGKHLDVSIGRDRVHFGHTPGASLYPSGRLPYQDGLRLSVPLGPFSFDYLLATIQPKKASHDVDPNRNAKEQDSDAFGFMKDSNPTTILTAVHRFQWNFGALKAGIGGTVVYARSNNMFLMTDILPVFIYHNADIRPNNLNMIFDLSWTFYPGFTLTGILGFDDISAKALGLPDGPTPTIPAGILQLEYSAAPGPVPDFLLEGGYTHYLWGNYAFGDADEVSWGEAPLARAIYRYAPNNQAILLPLTSPYGPGTIWGRLVSALDFPQFNLKIKADLLILSKLDGVNLVDTPYAGDDEVKNGRRILYVSLDLPCTYTWKYLELLFSPALLIKDRRAALECTVGLHFRLGHGYRHGKAP